LPVSAEDTKVVALGLTDHVVTEAELAEGAALAPPRFNSPGVAYALIGNAKKGDEVRLELKHGGNSLMHNVETLDADKAQFLLLAGKGGVPAGGWPEGTYTAAVKVTRDGKVVVEQESKPVAFE
jgi:hypothetical protein